MLAQFTKFVRPLCKTLAVRLHTSQCLPWLENNSQSDETIWNEQIDVITSPSRATADQSAERYSIARERIHVVSNPIETFDSSILRHSVNAKELVFFGRLAYEKGIDVLARAAVDVLNKHPSLRLTFIGPNQPWPEVGSSIQWLETFFSNHAFGTRVRILPAMNHDELKNYLRRAKICIFPSRMETFGMTVTEAMSWGVPVIVSDILPFQELVTHKKNGLLFENSDSESLSKMIHFGLENDQLLKKYSIAASRSVHQFRVKNIVDQLTKAWAIKHIHTTANLARN
jgi:glycosyltransferase involved in cell wall biosynthesis